MKKTLIVMLVAILAMGSTAFAQKNVKLGHINSTDLMQIMPGRDTAQAILQKESEELQEQLKTMYDEYEKQVSDYQERQAGWSELIRESQQKRIQDLAKRIQEFEENARERLSKRQEEVLQPIIDRAKKAIEQVAKENGYTYIFDAGVGVLLYQQDSDDIMPLVKKKLGL